jgi:hypothetical protein
MADKHLQFLDIPRKDPDKLTIELRTKHFREIYSQYSAESAAHGNVRSTTTFRIGWR